MTLQNRRYDAKCLLFGFGVPTLLLLIGCFFSIRIFGLIDGFTAIMLLSLIIYVTATSRVLIELLVVKIQMRRQLHLSKVKLPKAVVHFRP